MLELLAKGRTVTVDLSSEFGTGDRALPTMFRLAQIVFTLTQVPSVERAQFQLDGKPGKVSSGDGTVLDRPATRSHADQSKQHDRPDPAAPR